MVTWDWRELLAAVVVTVLSYISGHYVGSNKDKAK